MPAGSEAARAAESHAARITDLLQPPQTVPDELLGCWRRDWIRYADGTVDDTSVVIWLQTCSAMADLRLDSAVLGLAGDDVGGLVECGREQLLLLANSQSSSGITRCTALEADGSATATWHGSIEGVDFQPVSAFPEPGILSWNENGTVMIERAPSDAYVEQWRLLPSTRAPLVHTVLDDGSTSGRRTSMYLAGDTAMFVRDRVVPLRSGTSLADLVAAADRADAEALVDCEFSFAVRQGNAFVITLSTLPWRRGAHFVPPIDESARW